MTQNDSSRASLKPHYHAVKCSDKTTALVFTCDHTNFIYSKHRHEKCTTSNIQQYVHTQN